MRTTSEQQAAPLQFVNANDMKAGCKYHYQGRTVDVIEVTGEPGSRFVDIAYSLSTGERKLNRTPRNHETFFIAVV
jgi:hypothetical protein